jgi:phosphate transport system ATP-binding protein
MTGGIQTTGLSLWYTKFQALKEIDLTLQKGIVHGLIGPSAAGRRPSALLQSHQRAHPRRPHVGEGDDPRRGHLRARGGSVGAPEEGRHGLPAPQSAAAFVYENVVFGLKVHGQPITDDVVESSLTEVGLWDDLKDHLKKTATTLPLEQQQKLCIARLLPLKPEVL